MNIASWEESCYAPNGYILSESDSQVVAILKSTRVTPETWRSVWNFDFQTFVDIKNVSKARIRNLGMLAAPE